MREWSQTSSIEFQEGLDGAFAMADKSQFEWRTGFIDTAGTESKSEYAPRLSEIKVRGARGMVMLKFTMS